jgi:hypothetical protein
MGSLLVAILAVPLVALTGSVSAALAAAALAAPLGVLIAAGGWPARAVRVGRA